MSVLWGNGGRKSGWQSLVFLTGLSHCTTGHKILQLLTRAQAQHFFASAGRISGAQIFVHDIEELLELERCSAGKDRNQFLGHKIGNSARECVFLENSHKAQMISHFAHSAADFSRPARVRFYPKHSGPWLYHLRT